MDLEEFYKTAKEGLEQFFTTIRKYPDVAEKKLSYADWFDKFRSYEEVGTEEELNYYGTRILVKAQDG